MYRLYSQLLTILLVSAKLLYSTPNLGAAENDAAKIRIATYNASLYRDRAGQLTEDLEAGNAQARQIAEVIQRLQPDVILINEFDYDATGHAARLFCTKYLAIGQNGGKPIEYSNYFIAPVNTGLPTSRDLDKNGHKGDPADAIGYGRHEGQYGMLVLSRFQIDCARIRTFQKFLWRGMPDALLPIDPKTGDAYYDEEDLAILRLASKSFWDVPVDVQIGDDQPRMMLRLLCSHPTPPVFDGPEDRNGKRNHDEIRMVADYIDPARGDYLIDDSGVRGGLPSDALFVILGDLNCDPLDGDGIRSGINALLQHPRVDNSFVPASRGGPEIVKRYTDQHTKRRGDPAHVTANFTLEGVGCLRIDYALPSRSLQIVNSGVYWPIDGEIGYEAAKASDHRPVWIDVELTQP